MNGFYRTAAVLTLLVTLGAAVGWGWLMAASTLLGGALGMVNARWMWAGVEAVTSPQGQHQVSSVTTRFIGRLVLIFLVLFAIIHTSFLSLPGVVAGFSTGVGAAMVQEFRRIIGK